MNTLAGLSELQRLPFASKLVAFIDTENAGVYDNRINRFLADSGLGEPLLGSDGAVPQFERQMRQPQVTLVQNQRRYQNWCLRLQQIARELNAALPTVRWTCGTTGPQHWRAVDVERAIFAFAGDRSVVTRDAAETAVEADEFVRLLRRFLEQRPLACSQAT